MSSLSGPILNFSIRSLFMFVNSSCTGDACNSTANTQLVPDDPNDGKMFDDETKQRLWLDRANLNCTIHIEKSMNESRQSPDWCPIIWDSVTCWPATQAGELQRIACPEYIMNFNYEANATKQCLSNGSWNSWTDYSKCSTFKYYLAEHLPNYYLITAVGYTVSLIALLAALFIFTFNKRLRSPKNNLHMKLFLSFILRCVLFHIKRLNAFSDDLPDLNTTNNSTDLTLSNNMSSKPLACKLFTIIWQYSLLANYNFIFVEALYLQSLISFNTFTQNSSITRYVFFGWGVPALIVIPWSVTKYYYENNECWTSIDNTYIFWLIRGPITLSILLSFIIFVNVIRILYLKIFSSGLPNQIDRKYSKWFRSTLVLVPLFGVHHTLLLICKVLTFNKEIEIILFYFDLIFTSFQGFFVALLYCFFSSEVLAEVRKAWRRFRIKKSDQSLRHCPSNRMTSNTINSVLKQSINNADKQQIDKSVKNSRPSDQQSVKNEVDDKGIIATSRSSTRSEIVIPNHISNGTYIGLNETHLPSIIDPRIDCLAKSK